jgi:hypothetical protein
MRNRAKRVYQSFSGKDCFIPLPANGRYSVAVWHEQGQVGRYTFVVGDRELPGGDLTFPIKMKSYWTPVTSAPVPMPAPLLSHSCGK